MKKRLAVLITLAVMILACTASVAAADTRVSLHNDLTYDAGRLRIAWDVTGDEAGPYTVTVKVFNNGTASQILTEVGTTSGHFIETVDCIPGKSYEITVLDSKGNLLNRKKYKMEDPVTFEDGKLKDTSVKITITPRKTADGKNYTKIKSFKADEIMSAFLGGSDYYGMKYEMDMPQLIKARSFFVTLAFEAPNGFLYVEQATDVTFDRVANGKQTLWWNMAGADFFYRLFINTFEIPTGEYKVYLFWDGQLVNLSTFKVE